MELKRVDDPFLTEMEKKEYLLKVIGVGKADAVREQRASISAAIKTLTPFAYIDRVGRMHVKETCKILGDKPNIYYHISANDDEKNIVLAYIVMLFKRIKIKVPYNITFEFEEGTDKQWFKRELKYILDTLPEYCMVDTVYGN